MREVGAIRAMRGGCGGWVGWIRWRVMAEQVLGLQGEVAECRLCPRLVEWREQVAVDPPRRYLGQDYWARGVPGFGDPKAKFVIVGLAPAAHGANRTGRMFTGDRSGDFLYAALHRAGFSNQASSLSADDGLELKGVWITAAVRCAPPDNKPSLQERETCVSTYLARELEILQPTVILCLGGFAWSSVLRLYRDRAPEVRRPKFSHGARTTLDGLTVMVSFHPSQQNTFTRRLTPPMLDSVLRTAKLA